MLGKFVDHLGEIVLTFLGVAVCVVISVAAISASVFLGKATYESVTHWEQCPK